MISEVFADRRYMPDGTLVPRSRHDAQVDSDEEAIAQVLQMVRDGQVSSERQPGCRASRQHLSARRRAARRGVCRKIRQELLVAGIKVSA